MKKVKGFPALHIYKENIYENAKCVVELCGKHGIGVSGVIKGVNGLQIVTEKFIQAGCTQIASSRMEQLIDTKKHGYMIDTMLLRIPMKSELNDLVKHVDVSLNSESETIELIEKACAKIGKSHKVILMLDLGDLREGFFHAEELMDLAMHIENDLEFVKLGGVGTNLGCYGSVKPTVENLGALCIVAKNIEDRIGRKLEYVSGGATSTLPLVVSGEVPEGINNLRIGEAILLNMDMPELWEVHIEGLNQDTFLLEAQIIEIKKKPSYPVGELFIDAWGNKPTYEDRGVRTRALLAIGKQDFVMHDKLIPLDGGVEIIGSSSDHLIIDIENSSVGYKVGDTMKFKMFYGPMLHLCSSEWVRKTY